MNFLSINVLSIHFLSINEYFYPINEYFYPINFMVGSCKKSTFSFLPVVSPLDVIVSLIFDKNKSQYLLSGKLHRASMLIAINPHNS